LTFLVRVGNAGEIMKSHIGNSLRPIAVKGRGGEK